MVLFRFVLLFLIGFNCLAFNYPSSPQGRVSDYSGKLSTGEISSISAKLKEIEDKTGHQVAAAVFPDMGGGEIDSFSNELYRTWKLGQKDKNDGVLLVIAVAERKVRIEVGYGLEADLPDAKTAQIIRNDIKPKLKNGDWAGGVNGFAERMQSMFLAPPVEVIPVTAATSTADTGFPIWLAITIVFVFGGLVWWAFSYFAEKRRKEEAEEERLRRVQEHNEQLRRQRDRDNLARLEREREERMRAREKSEPEPAPSNNVGKVAAAVAAGAVLTGAALAAQNAEKERRAAAAAEEAAERRRRKKREEEEEEQRRARRRREDDEESSRRSSSSDSSSSWGSSFSDSFSGGGGDSGGGGSSDSF